MMQHGKIINPLMVAIKRQKQKQKRLVQYYKINNQVPAQLIDNPAQIGRLNLEYKHYKYHLSSVDTTFLLSHVKVFYTIFLHV